MSQQEKREHRFVPATREIEVAPGIVYRPLRSWHAGNLAGEGVETECGDRSGCVDLVDGRKRCSPPFTVTHRLYWNRANPKETISAFLSYPNAMGSCDQYFWEIYPGTDGDPDRFVGDKAEVDMEKRIVAALKTRKKRPSVTR